jgi:putative NADH-flavin reductase
LAAGIWVELVNISNQQETLIVSETKHLRIAVLGASGGIGRRVVDQALARGIDVVCQTRDAVTLADLAGRVRVVAFDPRDPLRLAEFIKGADAVIFALGVSSTSATTLFSEVTTALIAAMKSEGVKRLIAVTGVGAGETRGHGGFIYDRIVFPLFTHRVYEDKDRQEALISSSGLEWIIVRPAPFTKSTFKRPIEVYTHVKRDTVLRRINRDEVAAFIVEQIGSNRYLHQKPFIGRA